MGPLPTLSIEIKAHILHLCDQPTLAKTSGLSLAFLELSSPLLFKDVHIVGLEGLKRLLCRRNDQAQAHLSPFLDLPSISRFTFEWDGDDRESEDEDEDLSFDRLPSSTCPLLQGQITGQIAGESLLFLLPLAPDTSVDFCNSIFPLFSPSFVRLSTKFMDPTPFAITPIDLTTTPWPLLRTLTLHGVGTQQYLRSSSFFEVASESVTVVLDFTSTSEEPASLAGMEADLLKEVYGGQHDLLRAGQLKELVVKVATKEVEARVRHKVESRTKWKEMALEYRSRLRFEVVQSQ